MTKTTLSFRFLIICLFSLLIFSCRGKITKSSSIMKKPHVRGLSKLVVGASVVAGVCIVTESLLKKNFQSSTARHPISTNLKNESGEDLDIEVTLDGDNWLKSKIKAFDQIAVKSDIFGLYGLKCAGKIFKIDKSDTFIFNKVEGDLTIHSHGK